MLEAGSLGMERGCGLCGLCSPWWAGERPAVAAVSFAHGCRGRWELSWKSSPTATPGYSGEGFSLWLTEARQGVTDVDW